MAHIQRHLRRALVLIMLRLPWCWRATRTSSASEATYTRAKYPIVLVPGAFGFGAVAGVLDYFTKRAAVVRAPILREGSSGAVGYYRPGAVALPRL